MKKEILFYQYPAEYAEIFLNKEDIKDIRAYTIAKYAVDNNIGILDAFKYITLSDETKSDILTCIKKRDMIGIYKSHISTEMSTGRKKLMYHYPVNKIDDLTMSIDEFRLFCGDDINEYCCALRAYVSLKTIIGKRYEATISRDLLYARMAGCYKVDEYKDKLASEDNIATYIYDNYGSRQGFEKLKNMICEYYPNVQFLGFDSVGHTRGIRVVMTRKRY